MHDRLIEFGDKLIWISTIDYLDINAFEFSIVCTFHVGQRYEVITQYFEDEDHMKNWIDRIMEDLKKEFT